MRGRPIALPVAVLVAALPAVAPAACADPATCGCSVSASGLSFGAYDPQSAAPSDSVGTLSITCNSENAANSTVSVTLSRGAGSAVDRRVLQGPNATLAYNLYVDPARTTVWGDEATGGVVAPFPPNGGTQTLRIYGRIPGRQPIAAGAYSDTITILLTY